MEKNNFNKAYIYIIAIFAIGVAISNIIAFFNGVGFALIGASLLLILAISTILKDEKHKKRFGDIFALIIFELIMLIVLFFAYDFNLSGITNKFPLVMRNICAIYSLIATGYVIFRYISEIKGKKYTVIEYILGNYVPDKDSKKKSKEKSKKNKELENGTLEPKPSSIENSTAQSEDVQNPEESNQNDEGSVGETENKDEKQEEDKPTTTNRTNFW